MQQPNDGSHRRIRVLAIANLAAIVALAVLSIPMLFQGRRTICTSSMRQLTFALKLHAWDHEGRLPSVEVREDAPVDTGAIVAELRPYCSSPRVFRCPQSREGDTPLDYHFQYRQVSEDGGRFMATLYAVGEDFANHDPDRIVTLGAYGTTCRGYMLSGCADGHLDYRFQQLTFYRPSPPPGGWRYRRFAAWRLGDV